MTPQTRAYLLNLALREKETAAQDLIRTGEETSPAWGEAAAAVRELLEETLRLPVSSDDKN